MKALANLPGATKDLLFPVLTARPWPNAKELSRTWEKIHESIGLRRFALDLDHSKWGVEGKTGASQEFNGLFEAENGFAKYYECVENIEQAVPVLRLEHNGAQSVAAQAAHIARIDRGAVLRLIQGRVQNPIGLLQNVLQELDDCLVVVDCWWAGRDLLNSQVWASGIVQAITDENPEAEIVVAGSSFPDTFVHQGARDRVSVLERPLFDELVRRHNAARLIYGDWGSTRPPSDPVPMKLIPRIDLPLRGDWICFRRDKDYDPDESYEEIAQRVLADADWPHGLNIWGTYTISNTANGLPGGIASPATAAAARVNIHLHRQAYFGGPFEASDDDEPYVD